MGTSHGLDVPLAPPSGSCKRRCHLHSSAEPRQHSQEICSETAWMSSGAPRSGEEKVSSLVCSGDGPRTQRPEGSRQEMRAFSAAPDHANAIGHIKNKECLG